MITRIHHISLLTSDLERSIRFYADLLGLTVNSDRPEFAFDGAWLDIGDQQLHLICAEDPGAMAAGASRCGRDRHLALVVDQLDTLIDKLERANIPYEKSRSGRAAVFCRDPDGNALEFIGSGA